MVFYNFPMFLNGHRRFGHRVRDVRCHITAVHTASTRSIHPRHPELPISTFIFPNFPLPIFWGPVVRQISTSKNHNLRVDLDIDCVSNLWDPSREMRIDLLCRHFILIFVRISQESRVIAFSVGKPIQKPKLRVVGFLTILLK